MIKLVFFDWNGTLLSDATANLEATNDVLRLFSIKSMTIKTFRDLFEVPITKFYSKVGVDEKLFFENHSKIQETFHGSYEKHSERCKTRIGTGVLLKWLHSEGIRSVILSNHTVEGIEKHLKRLKLEKYVDAVLANDNIMSTGVKDKAKYAEDYVKEKGFGPSQILVVGDAPEEAKIARQLNAKSVLVFGGWYSERRLKEASPDYIIGRLDKLIGVIKDIQGKPN
jgi:phosphoglycolate phosphatase